MILNEDGLKVKVSDVNAIKMSVKPPKAVEDAGGRVIHEGEIKRWVGIGWVIERKACKDDYYKIPEVIND